VTADGADTPTRDSAGLFDTVRLEAFSDGVFAIASTLLVLQFKIPPAAPTTAEAGGLAALILSRWPSFLGYVLSFAVVGIMWINHHTMFQYIKRANRTFLLLNLVVLLWVSFLPFPTALLAEHMQVPVDRKTAMVLYSATLFVMTTSFCVLWRYGVNKDLGPDTSEAGIRALSRRALVSPLLYGVAFGLAFISVPACLILNVALIALFVWPIRW
jgi:uncharacterized membrane protein